MSIPGVNIEAFVTALQTHLSPSTPVQTPGQLFGRENQLRRIDQALHAKGRHIFVHGDRGVGKTSLAQTAAALHQSAERAPIIVGCSRGTSFYGVVKAIVAKLLPGPMAGRSSKTTKRALNVPGLEVTVENQSTLDSVPEVNEMNEAVALVRYVAEHYSKQTLVVVDEFDLVTEKVDKALFADFIKQLGDLKVPVQFIFCGIGESLDTLLGAHGSCYRYIESVPVPRLHFEARWEIMDRSAEALGVTIGKEPRYRIAAISDGFPYYVHLLCEKMYWEMFNSEEIERVVTKNVYAAAIKVAIDGIQQELRRAYEKATIRRSSHYEPILWAAADHSNIPRATNSIYSSYREIVNELGGDPLEKPSFNRHLAMLRSEDSGNILVGHPPGYHRFREGMLRGYVRLRAESEGVMLDADYGDPPAKGKAEVREWRMKALRGWHGLMRAGAKGAFRK